MGYLTLKTCCEYSFEEKKSKFIGNAARVENEEDAREFLEKIRKSNPEARHNVYAYIIGENMGIQRYNDDGEPQGTGGIPVLEVLKKNNITNCIVVVTRYFGGILLGKGGLVRAYSKAASNAVKNAGIVEKVAGIPIKVTIEYDMLGKFKYNCEQNDYFIENVDYTDKVVLLFYCEKSNKEVFNKFVINAALGKCSIDEEPEKIFFKEGKRLYCII